VTRPAAGLITRRPEEPYVKSTSTVLWELGAGDGPWLPDPEQRRTGLEDMTYTAIEQTLLAAVVFARRQIPPVRWSWYEPLEGCGPM